MRIWLPFGFRFELALFKRTDTEVVRRRVRSLFDMTDVRCPNCHRHLFYYNRGMNEVHAAVRCDCDKDVTVNKSEEKPLVVWAS